MVDLLCIALSVSTYFSALKYCNKKCTHSPIRAEVFLV